MMYMLGIEISFSSEEEIKNPVIDLICFLWQEPQGPCHLKRMGFVRMVYYLF